MISQFRQLFSGDYNVYFTVIYCYMLKKIKGFLSFSTVPFWFQWKVNMKTELLTSCLCLSHENALNQKVRETTKLWCHGRSLSVAQIDGAMRKRSREPLTEWQRWKSSCSSASSCFSYRVSSYLFWILAQWQKSVYFVRKVNFDKYNSGRDAEMMNWFMKNERDAVTASDDFKNTT